MTKNFGKYLHKHDKIVDKCQKIWQNIENEENNIMNKARRKELAAICKELQAVNDTINELDYSIECELEAENDGFNNLTEGLQATARGQAMEEAVDAMDDARRALKRAKTEINEAISNLLNAQI